MAKTIQKELKFIQQAIKELELSLPMITTASQNKDALNHVTNAANNLIDLTFDESFEDLADVMLELVELQSSILLTVTFQAYILDILEMLTAIAAEVEKQGLPKETAAYDLQLTGEFLVRLSGRLTNRYKLNVTFEDDYEAKSIRAFMVIKELRDISRFLNISPDISTNQNANLDNGLEIDLLSSAPPEELHRVAGSVLEVKNVQIFTETKSQSVMMLDPPHAVDSFDSKIEKFLNA